jgi:hypothetical protein
MMTYGGVESNSPPFLRTCQKSKRLILSEDSSEFEEARGNNP